MSEIEQIWDQYHFAEIEEGTALFFLHAFLDSLATKTDNLLILEANTVDSYLDSDDDGSEAKPIVAYPVYLLAPALNQYRIRLMTIIQYKLVGVFPVDIQCHFDNSTYQNVQIEELIPVVGKIFSKSIVKSTIENLYRRSLESRAQSQSQAS